MPEVLNIHDGGLQKIGGRTLGVVIVELVNGEGEPYQLVGYCMPVHKEQMIWRLKRIIGQTATIAGTKE